jgi:hypothetical protein
LEGCGKGAEGGFFLMFEWLGPNFLINATVSCPKTLEKLAMRQPQFCHQSQLVLKCPNFKTFH